MTAPRVVVTGIGALTPLGNDAASSWTALVAGKSGAGPVTAFDASPYLTKFACEVKDFDPEQWIERRVARRMDRYAQLAVAAGRMAVEDAGLDISANPTRVGVSLASGIGGIRSFQEGYGTLLTRGPERMNPLTIPTILPNMGAGWLSIELGARGPALSECTACAASTMSIGVALDTMRAGRCDVMLAGGAEAAVTELALGGFAATRAISRRNDDPEGASRPFDATRDGFVVGEGAAVMVLETEQHAQARGARVLAELAGYGASADAHHMTEPEPSGAGQSAAILSALEDSGATPADVDYVNAHATSTPVGDAAETTAIKLALGERAMQIPISSTKGATGHCFGAAGAIEAVFSVQALMHQLVPPTINYEHPDPACDLDVVPNEARAADLAFVISNGFG
ncbi:MAG: 3-oxoacyl-[acyl-carrier-protein] synthase, partial [Gaiellaceae bacterium]|nr:3-oxoacyl-[acyl-carrier-protein] synthase [Gaiellaceae bacterium]